jgi:hypothetical protein
MVTARRLRGTRLCRLIARRLLVLWLAALFPASIMLMAAPARSLAADQSPSTTRIWMRNLVLFPYNDVPTEVSALSGQVRPTRQGQPVLLDDVTSYGIVVDHASMRLTADDVTALMNRHILPMGNSPIKHVDVSFGDGSISMSGTMVKVGVPVPFTATAVLSPTNDGDLRVHMTAMRAGDVVPKSVMDALGMQMSKIAQPTNRRAFHMEDDDMVIPLASMFPPPVFTGRLTSVRVSPTGLFGTIGKRDPDNPPTVPSRSYLCMRGGTVMFAKLTMRDADMTMVPADSERDLGFSPSNYYSQMVGGVTISEPDRGLVARVKDFRDVRADH